MYIVHHPVLSLPSVKSTQTPARVLGTSGHGRIEESVVARAGWLQQGTSLSVNDVLSFIDSLQPVLECRLLRPDAGRH